MADSIPPYTMADLGNDARLQSPAVARNLEPIRDVLADWLPEAGLVLEVSSGTGEHVVAFARAFPQLEWLPTDPDPAALVSIAAWSEEGPPNLRPPQFLDTITGEWPVERADALLNINMVHIAPIEATYGLLDGAAKLLPPGAPLILYGPWVERGIGPAPSNLAFDASLRARNSRWGLREVEWFAQEAAHRGLDLVERRAMPSNNLMLRLVRA